MATWDATFEVNPEDTDDASLGDDEMRADRIAVRERAENEHTTYSDGTGGTTLLDWAHKPGSAKGYFQNAAPGVRPNAATALNADDAGRIWFDDDADDLPYFYDGTDPYDVAGWKGLLRTFVRFSIQGTLAVGSDVIPRIIFPKGCTIVRVDAIVTTAPTGAALRVDLEKTGANSIFGANDYVEIAIAANTGNSTDMDGTHNVLAAGDYLTVDIDQVGSTVAGADLSVAIEAFIG
jgi:hypothetical protein